METVRSESVRSEDDLESGERHAAPPHIGVSALGPVGPRQQLLRMECMSARHTRQLLGGLAVARNVTTLLMVALLVLRLKPLEDGAQYFCSESSNAVNAAFGALTAAAALLVAAAAARQVLLSLCARLVWTARRRTVVARHALQLAATFIGTCCFLAANAIALAPGPAPCGAPAARHAVHWLSFVRWSCINVFMASLLVGAHNTCILDGRPTQPSEGGGGGGGAGADERARAAGEPGGAPGGQSMEGPQRGGAPAPAGPDRKLDGHMKQRDAPLDDAMPGIQQMWRRLGFA
ncbi:hypothetical protein MNEG_14123 [Monoraphidium neglectum]|uniref:Uncharacterized protein n=1 Tax=Monoraphidium neglectum TaxID=145388 RepID=A0A0D2KDE9_9CHLO|nr:hypothetical protein MNEG_14123 [Monoraphidium neglectum]KIY93838.1 hypothetical protein MNEG_14123 [Monoraphidium neglectum]|eukprot:XP_013892858.1 hypothetical protein MNEG_14123 [Monoraphidium neglectum]